MGVEKINARSYRRPEQRNLVFAAIICWFFMALNLYALFNPFLHHFPNISPTIYNYSNSRTDVYEINGDVRIQGSSSAIFIASSGGRRHLEELSWIDSRTIRPYPRKYDPVAMRTTSGFKIKTGSSDSIPPCSRSLDAPAVLFSTGGHATNHFHAVTDVLIPLFATSHHFNRNVIFLAANHQPKLFHKHKRTVENLSKYEVYDVDKIQETLCFPRMIIGLKTNPVDLSIDPSESSTLSTRNFTKFMRSAYSLERESVHDHRRRPRMLVVSRSTTRRLTNQQELADMARGLGFEPVMQDLGWNMTSIAKLVNTFDVMVGVHGAALANMVFLPEDAVVIQITPMGVDTFARVCYEAAPAEMKLKYLEYKVSLNESSLLGKYPPDSEVYKDPVGVCRRKGFDGCKKLYMDNQDMNLDLGRFRNTLTEALNLLAA